MPLSRRDFLKIGSAAALLSGFHPQPGEPTVSAHENLGSIVNDVHSQLNPTRVSGIVRPTNIEDLGTVVRLAKQQGKAISIAGRRHSMGGQQFGTDTFLVDTSGLNRVLGFDAERGLVEVEAGIEWPELLGYLKTVQEGREHQWGILQKQTGADRLTLGGALASNVHGRGLTLKPIIDQIEAFTILDHAGRLKRCGRHENAELFRAAIGGYGLFGIVTTITLRLGPRRKVERVVKIEESKNIVRAFEQRIADGFLYGDFQYATDSNRDSFLRRGVFSCYRPVPPDTPLTQNPTRFRPADWAKLTYYTHKYKRRAFAVYTSRYLATSGQIYWADSQLSGAYVDDYHTDLDRKLGAKVKATEMITEIYVPRASLFDFLEAARDSLRARRANVIYGTVRLIERDDESFLRWATKPYACIIFNLHVVHDPAGLESAAEAFRDLIDLGIRYDGSYYLTYHRYATRRQVEACYPQFKDFLALKLKHDPDETFQSDWYRHYKNMFS